MDLGIEGKRARGCAAGNGLGRGCAEALVAEGINVGITARGDAALQDTATASCALDPAARVVAVVGDITKPPESRAAAPAACPQVDILVKSAGGPPPGDFRDWDRAALSLLNATACTGAPVMMMMMAIKRAVASRWQR